MINAQDSASQVKGTRKLLGNGLKYIRRSKHADPSKLPVEDANDIRSEGNTERNGQIQTTPHTIPHEDSLGEGASPCLISADDDLAALRKKIQDLENENQDLRGQRDTAAAVSDMRKNQVDAMQSSIDSKKLQIWSLRSQCTESEVVRRFDVLFSSKIPTWANKFTSKRPCFPSKLDELKDGGEDYELFSQVNPDCQNRVGLMATLRDRSSRIIFARGLVARLLCNNIFPPGGKDHWLDKETRHKIEEIESILRPPSDLDGSPESPSHREYNDWRTITMNLFEKLHSTAPDALEKEYTAFLRTLASSTQILDSWEDTSEQRGIGDLMDILKEAIDFSKSLRLQRPCWSVTLPTLALENISEAGPGGAMKASPMSSRKWQAVQYNSHEMRDAGAVMGQSGDEDEGKRLVQYFITPTLSKKGDSDGQRFEAPIQVVRRAEVWLAVGQIRRDPTTSDCT